MPDREVIFLRVSPAMKRQLQQISAEEDSSLNAFVMRLLIDYVQTQQPVLDLLTLSDRLNLLADNITRYAQQQPAGR